MPLVESDDSSRGGQLLTDNPADRISLRGVRLLCRVAGISARCTVEQTFANLEDKAIEAVYTFPIPDGAAVCGFEVVFFDKIYTGALEESDKAAEQYEDAISQGHGAYLVEQNRPDVFSIRVGNLKPRQAVTLRLQYVIDLEVVDRAIRLSFPTTIAPRYVTDSGTDPIDAAIDGQALNPPHVLSVPYGFSAEIDIDMGKLLAGVTSPSHKIQIAGGEEAQKIDEIHRAGGCVAMDGESAKRLFEARDRVRVTLAGGLAEMNRELVLNLELSKDREPLALSAVSPSGERFVAVSFVPEFEEEDLETPSPAETVFLIDCSGSMEGESIQQAVAAVECCLRAMSAGDRFNVCRFGSTFEMLAPEPLVYAEETLKTAVAFIRRGADLGGTEILAPLEKIFATRPAGEVRNVVIMTDGQVSNEPAVIDLARRRRSRNRVFTFGIGPACSQFLVRGLARVTGGAAEFITPGERIEDKVLRTFGRLASPPVTDVEIDWGNADADVAPKEIPPVFDGDVVRAYARVTDTLGREVKLKCITPRGPRRWSVPVREARDSADVLPRLWARAAIRSIEDQDAQAAHSQIASTSSSASKRMVELSKRYGVACAKTSFVAIEHRSLEDRNEGRPELRRIPVMLAAGWGGIEAAAGGAGSGVVACMAADMSVMSAPAAIPCAPSPARATASAAAPPPAQRSRPAGGGLFGKLRKAFGGGGPGAPSLGLGGAGIRDPRKRDEFDKAIAEFVMSSDDADESDAGSGDPLVDLLACQRANGSFASGPDRDAALLRAGVDVRNLRTAVEQVVRSLYPDRREDSEINGTFMVLAALRMALTAREAVWRRAARKSHEWLRQQLGCKGGVTSVIVVKIVAAAGAVGGKQ